jgi:hypothetical protein
MEYEAVRKVRTSGVLHPDLRSLKLKRSVETRISSSVRLARKWTRS